MTGQMCWLAKFGSESKILHLRLQPHHPWKPYNLFPGCSVPDYNVPGGSKGLATFQSLHRAGWEMVATKDASTKIGSPARQEAA